MRKKKLIAGILALTIAMSTAALPCGAVENGGSGASTVEVSAEAVSSAAVAEETTVESSGLASSGYTVKEYLKKLDDQNIYYEYNEAKNELLTLMYDEENTVYKNGDFLYAKYDKGAAIVGYVGSSTENITIPEKINGLTVVAIGGVSFEYADYDNNTNTFTKDYSIAGYSYFYCDDNVDWTYIIVPDSVTRFDGIYQLFFDWETGEWNGKLFACTPGSSAEEYAMDYVPYFDLIDEDGNYLNWTPEINTAYSSTTNSVTISWKKKDFASGYRVYRYNTSKKKWESVKTLFGNEKTTYKDTKLTAGTNYKYKVKMFRKVNGHTGWSASASDVVTTATKPTTMKFTASSASKTAIRLKWGKVNASGYKLQQYNASTKTWKTVKVLKQSETEYKVTGLKKGTSYKFRIQAYRTGGVQKAFGAWSATKTVATKK